MGSCCSSTKKEYKKMKELNSDNKVKYNNLLNENKQTNYLDNNKYSNVKFNIVIFIEILN